MSSHSPGPWTVRKTKHTKAGVLVVEVENAKRQSLFDLTCYLPTHHENASNGNLILLAPRLAESLRAALSLLSDLGGEDDLSQEGKKTYRVIQATVTEMEKNT